MTRPNPRSGVGEDGRWTPVFEGQRPPTRAGEPGPALKSGCYSVLTLRPRAAEIREALEEIVPLTSQADGPLLDVASGLLAQAERGLLVLETAQREEIEAIRKDKRLDPEQRQNLTRLSADCRGWLNSAMRALDQLGCSPTARARLGLDVARMHSEAVRAELLERYGSGSESEQAA